MYRFLFSSKIDLIENGIVLENVSSDEPIDNLNGKYFKRSFFNGDFKGLHNNRELFLRLNEF